VAERLDFRPGQLVLDWGSGCGHTLTWAKMLYDVDGVGVELTPSAANWASRFAQGRFCNVDGRRLDWVPDGLFDHVFSYGSLPHLGADDQCAVVVELVAKLRIGGKAFFGWNRAHLQSPWAWFECFHWSALGRKRVEVQGLEAVEESLLFPSDRDRPGGCWTWEYPSYAVTLTRRA